MQVLPLSSVVSWYEELKDLLDEKTLDNLNREVEEQMQEYYGDTKDYKNNGTYQSTYKFYLYIQMNSSF